MGRVVGSSLVFLMFIYCVQCQWNQIVDSEDFELLDTKSLRTSHQVGWSLQRVDRQVNSHPKSALASKTPSHTGILPKTQFSSNRRRTRRQAFQLKNFNAVEEPFSWNHQFNIEENHPTSLTKESAYIWQENTKRLKHTLEKDTKFQFVNPSGLRITIPANNVIMRIVDFRYKLNEEFRGNDGGIFNPGYKSGGLWTYDIPHLRVKQGDKMYYWMRLSLSKEGFDIIVKGVLDVTLGNPHSAGPRAETIAFRPTSVPALAPQPQTFGGGYSPAQGDGTKDPFVWNHQFTINSTISEGFTRDRWLQHMEFLKRFFEKHINFKFLNPAGLVISVPDDNINIVDFRIKLNAEFRENDGGHFTPDSYKSSGLWTYSIPQLSVKQGDKIYYWMRIKRGQDGFDDIVKGVLEINQGNPHTDSTVLSPASVPSYPQTSFAVNPSRPVGGGQPTVGGGQVPYGGVQPSIGGEQPTGTQQGNTGGGQPFSWDHKFVSVNLNTTSNEFAGSLPDKADEVLKKTLDRNIKFQFLNPSGLSILISGNNNHFRVLDFHIKLNEEFKNLDPGHYEANVTKLRDGRWNYYYSNLKLKEGDNVYYWMRILYGQESWLYVVRGQLEVTQGNPHQGPNQIRTTSPPPNYQVYNKPTVASSPPPTYQVYNKPTVASDVRGQAVRWDHRFSINSTSKGGLPTNEEVQLLKNSLEKNMNLKFVNPSGLSLSFSGEDKDFRMLAFNIKLNEEFRNLGSGDYVANITKLTDGRWNYYYPNLKVKQGDKVYYWMRVMLGKELTDYVVKGELKLLQGDPHIGGPIAEVPPPVILTQTSSRPTQVPPAQAPSQSSDTPLPSQLSNNQPPIQAPQTETFNRFGAYQSPDESLPTQPAASWNNNQSPQSPVPLPLAINQFPSIPDSVSSPSLQTQPCSTSQLGQNAELTFSPCQEDTTGYHFNNKDGHPTHQVAIGRRNPVLTSVQMDNNKYIKQPS